MGIITIIQAVIVMLGFHVQEAREVVGNTVTKRKLETLISFRGGTSKVEAVVSPVEPRFSRQKFVFGFVGLLCMSIRTYP